MLPEYKKPQFMRAALTDAIMMTALERRELPVSIETARSACYCWMSHAMVWNDILEKFQKELAAGDSDCKGASALDVVIALSNEMDKALCDAEISAYRDTKLDKGKVCNAMRTFGVIDENAVLTLLAALAVEGRSGMMENYDDMLLLEESGLSMDSLVAIANAY